MNGEFDDWFKSFEDATQELERFFREAAEAAAETADAVMQIPIVLAEQVEEAIATEFDRFLDTLDEWFSPPVHVSARFDMRWNLDDFDPWQEIPKPSVTHHPACIGCQHFHGYTYSGEMLVCAMHPYGWEGDDCPDWESSEKD